MLRRYWKSQQCQGRKYSNARQRNIQADDRYFRHENKSIYDEVILATRSAVARAAYIGVGRGTGTRKRQHRVYWHTHALIRTRTWYVCGNRARGRGVLDGYRGGQPGGVPAACPGMNASNTTGTGYSIALFSRRPPRDDQPGRTRHGWRKLIICRLMASLEQPHTISLLNRWYRGTLFRASATPGVESLGRC